MTNLVRFETPLNYELLLDGTFATPFGDIGVFVGEGKSDVHFVEQMLIEALAESVRRMNRSLGIVGDFHVRLIFLRQRYGTTAEPLHGGNADMPDKTQKLENKLTPTMQHAFSPSGRSPCHIASAGTM